MKYKLIYIEWEDAVLSSSWKNEEAMLEWGKKTSMITRQVGWLVAENPRYIQLASEWSPDDDQNDEVFNHHQKIPKTWIRKRKVIKL